MPHTLWNKFRHRKARSRDFKHFPTCIDSSDINILTLKVFKKVIATGGLECLSLSVSLYYNLNLLQ